MIYRFVIVSAEVRSFRRDVRIESDATFEALQEALYSEIGYDLSYPALFALTDHAWQRHLLVYQQEPSDSRSDEDVYLMHHTSLDELLRREGDRLMLIYDTEGSRCFYIELREVMPGRLSSPFEISRSEGDAPLQLLPKPAEEKKPAPKEVTVAKVPDEATQRQRKQLNDEATPDEYGSDAFDSSELDPEGFGTADEEGEPDDDLSTIGESVF